MEHMVKVGDSLSDPKKSLEDLMERGHETLICKIKKLREDIEAKRLLQIKEKLNECGKKLQNHIHGILSTTSRENQTSEKNIESEVPHLGIESSLCILNGLLPGSPDKEFANAQEPVLSKSTKLQKVQKIPPYTTWIFLHRNQRMPEDQSVVGRRRIYYDQSGNEALICSDSEDDIAEMDEEKREFSSGEDQIIWMAFQEHGLNEDVIDVVSHFIGGTSVEIQERYHELKQKLETTQLQDSTKSNTFLEKSLSAALDSLDNLFCRRCLVFDCRLHGCSQNLVYPSEKQLSWCEPEDKKPCSDKCYLRTRQSAVVHGSVIDSVIQRRRNILERGNTCWSALSCKDDVCDGDDTMHSLEFAAGETSISETTSSARVAPVMHHGSMGKRKGNDVDDEEFGGVGVSDNSLDKKMKKNQVVDSVTACGEAASATAISSVRTDTSNVRPSNKMDIQVADNCFMQSLSPSTFTAPRILNSPTVDTVQDERQDLNDKLGLKEKTKSLREQTKTLSTGCEWKPLEKDLYAKGLEIFGRNSCLIARNLLSGLKTCSEVFTYMHSGGVPPKKLDAAHSSEGLVRADSDYMEQELSVRPRSRLIRKRGRSKRLKYSTKSNGHPSSWRRIGDGDHSCKQYTPCSCQNVCGKDCSCLNNGTCCEKYCGCSKSCKNRFRGCHCAKSNCRSRQCPCFAANRECDPDVCRNCWVSCGGGSLGEPPKRGDGQCGNMRLLLRQQQRVLLARSDVAGWGAFIKNSVNKHDYLGEYTGELISHREADKRGKIYDRANSSFLFDLNDQYVLDACRQGDKLKFANHSSKPNCYCKVMLVAGDHRVGIFAKERIEAKEELFYDYRYGPDQAPAWARTPGTSKKDDALPCQGRPRKHQSR